MTEPESVPLEDFVKALSAQLDRAQAALALKARNTELTFAVRELNLDLKAQVSMEAAAIRIRPAEPGEPGASTISISFTTVSRKTLEENALATQAAEPAISDEVEDLSEEERRRLEWIGVTNLRQLQRAEAAGGEHEIRRLANIPAQRLRRALQVAQGRRVTGVRPVGEVAAPTPRPGAGEGPGAPPRPGHWLSPAERLRLRLNGRNLAAGPLAAEVDGRPAAIVARDETGLTLAPERLSRRGSVTLSYADGEVITAPYALGPDAEGGEA